MPKIGKLTRSIEVGKELQEGGNGNEGTHITPQLRTERREKQEWMDEGLCVPQRAIFTSFCIFGPP